MSRFGVGTGVRNYALIPTEKKRRKRLTICIICISISNTKKGKQRRLRNDNCTTGRIRDTGI